MFKTGKMTESSTYSYEWYTPKWLCDIAREVLGGIDIDPASTELANKSVGARVFLTKDDNSLESDWSTVCGKSPYLLFMNPPGGRVAGKRGGLQIAFWRKLCSEFLDGKCCSAFTVHFNSQQVHTFANHCQFGPLEYYVCFLHKWVHYDRSDGGPSTRPIYPTAVSLLSKDRDTVKRFIDLMVNHGTVATKAEPLDI